MTDDSRLRAVTHRDPSVGATPDGSPVVDLTAVPATDELSLLGQVEERLTGHGHSARWERRHVTALVGADAICLLLAVVPLTVAVRGASRVTALLGLPLVWLAIAVLGRAYERRRNTSLADQLRTTWETGIRTIALVVGVLFLADRNPPRAATAVGLLLVLALPAVGRVVVRQVLHIIRRRGHWLHRVVAVGPAEEVRAFVAETVFRPEAGLTVIGACTPEDIRRLALGGDRDVPCFGPPELAGTAARALSADCVAVLPAALSRHKFRRLAWELEGSAVQLLVAPAMTDVAGPRIHVRPVNAFPLLHLEQPTFTGVQRVFKHATDRLVAGFGLLLLSPLLLLLTVLIRRDSPGGALFRQHRVGQGGEPFTCYKFRTMLADADRMVVDLADRNETGGPLFKIRQDPRITRIGALLRRYSLDELPQLMNVLRGEMSLVGPRPPLQREVDTYADDVRRRLLVRPGMTGLWQVSGRSDLSWEETVRLDLYYVENWSPLLDLIILWRTVSAVLTARGAY